VLCIDAGTDSRLVGRSTCTIGTAALAGGIFVFDVLTPVAVSASILYVLVILVASRIYDRPG
jgi:hypothetical protein